MEPQDADDTSLGLPVDLSVAQAAKGSLAAGFFEDRSGVIPGLSAYFNSKVFSDLTVVAPDGRRLPCHQIVLSSGSKRFAKILEEGILQGEPELPVWGVDSDALEAVLRCFYTGQCLLTAGNVVAIMDAAQRLEVANLPAFCDNYLRDVLQQYNCLSFLAQAVHYKMEDVALTILQFTETCFTDIIVLEEYYRCDLPVVVKFLQHARQVLDPSIVLRAGWEWIVYDAEHSKHLHEIAACVDLPDGMQPEDLLQHVKALEHGITWRMLPDPKPVEEQHPPDVPTDLLDGTMDLSGVHDESGLDPLLGMSNIPLLQTSLLPPLTGQLPLHMMLPVSDQLTNNPEEASNTLAADASSLLGVGNASTAAAWPPNLASEILAQINPAFNLQSALAATNTPPHLNSPPSGTSTLPPELVTRLGELQGRADNRRHTPSRDDDSAPATAARRSGSNRSGGPRGVCQVEGCNTDLNNLRDYHQRYKICEFHLKIPSVLKDGAPQRFCQQCGRFQLLSEFEGNKRSCKARLQRHNDRRRKRLEEEPVSGYYGKRGRSMGEEDGMTGLGRTSGLGNGAAVVTGAGGSSRAASTAAWPALNSAGLQVLAELIRANSTAAAAAGNAGASLLGQAMASAATTDAQHTVDLTGAGDGALTDLTAAI